MDSDGGCLHTLNPTGKVAQVKQLKGNAVMESSKGRNGRGWGVSGTPFGPTLDKANRKQGRLKGGTTMPNKTKLHNLTLTAFNKHLSWLSHDAQQ